MSSKKYEDARGVMIVNDNHLGVISTSETVVRGCVREVQIEGNVEVGWQQNRFGGIETSVGRGRT